MLQTILSILLLFFVPGFALTLALFPKKEINIVERIGLSILLSISMSVLPIFLAGYFMHFEVTLTTILFNILFWTFLFEFIYLYRTRKIDFKFNPTNYLTNLTIEKEKILKALLLALILVFVFYVVYEVHKDYPYPYHSDEWWHISQAVQIIDEKEIKQTEAYYKNDPYSMNLEIGFHIFLAEFFILSNQDPVLFYKFIPAIFACIASFILFILVYRINFYAALFSILFFSSLKTNISILGTWFFVPLTMSFPLIYGFFYFMSEGIKKNSFVLLFLSTIIITTIALIHPCSASWIYPVVIIYLIFLILFWLIKHLIKHKELNLMGALLKNKKSVLGVLILFSLPFVSFIYFFKLLWNETLEKTINSFITGFIVFEASLENKVIYEFSYLTNFYGSIMIFFAIVGIVYCIQKRQFLLIAWASVMAGMFAIFFIPSLGALVHDFMHLAKQPPFMLLAFYERYVAYAGICLAPLAGIGLFALLNGVYQILNNLNKNFKEEKIVFRVIAIIIAIILIYLIFSSAFTGYYENKTKLYKLIDEDDYKAMKWLEENKGINNVVIARPEVSAGIYPISRNYVIFIALKRGSKEGQDIYDFFMGDCKTKREILVKYQVNYVLIDFKVKCSDLKLIYSENKKFIYEFES